MLFLSYYIVLHRSVPLISLIIVGIPTYFATYIACTRIVDYQHFYSDVLGGIMIGVFFAVASFSHYSVYFHSAGSVKNSVYSKTQPLGESVSCPSPLSQQDATVAIEIDE